MFNIARAWQATIAISLAAMGGLARLLNAKDHTKLKWSRIFSELFISGFTGSMMFMLSLSFNLDGDWIGLVCGIAGWIGPRMLDMISEQTGKKLGFDVDLSKKTTVKAKE